MSNYWQKRFQAVEEMNNKVAKETVQSIIPSFDKAQAQIEREINAWYGRFAKNNQISLQEAKKLLNTKELKEFRWDVEEYIKYGRQNAIDQQWMKQLENASARFHVSRLEALKIRTQNAAERAFGNELDQIDQMAARIYMDDYYHTAYEIQKGFGIGFDVAQIDQRKLDKVLSKPWTTDKMTFSDRVWKSKTQLVDSLHTELTQMCVLGKAPDQAISNIAKRMNVSKNQAGRLVMTEAAYFGSAAQKDCFNDLDVEKYEIVATLDSRTSEVCQQMDGKVFDMKDFQAGVTAPPFHVWCRSCTVPWFEDNDDGTRAARGADGKTYQVPANMKYEDWKNTFVDKTKDPDKYLKKVNEKDIIKDKTFKEKIEDIKQEIAKNGGNITEDQIQNAGKAFQEELLKSDHMVKLKDLESKKTVIQQKYDDAKKNLNDRLKEKGIKEKDWTNYELSKKFLNFGFDDEAERFEKFKKIIEDADPKIFDLAKVKDDLYEELRNIEKEFRKMNSEITNADEVKKIFSQIREMGSDGIDVKRHLCNSRSEVRQYVEQAYSYYPKEWVDASVKYGTLKPKKVQRGYYDGYEIAISGSGNSAVSTSLHELGHRMEDIFPAIKKAEKEFYNRRTVGEDLEWLGSGYSRDEKTRKDKFLRPYMGKDYGGSAYELVSMGFEYGYTNPMYLMKDPDMSTWIYGIISLF